MSHIILKSIRNVIDLDTLTSNFSIHRQSLSSSLVTILPSTQTVLVVYRDFLVFDCDGGAASSSGRHFGWRHFAQEKPKTTSYKMAIRGEICSHLFHSFYNLAVWQITLEKIEVISITTLALPQFSTNISASDKKSLPCAHAQSKVNSK